MTTKRLNNRKSSTLAKAAMLFVIMASFGAGNADAQLGGLLKKAKDKLKEKVEQKIDNKIEKITDKIVNAPEEGLEEATTADEMEVPVEKAPTINTSTDFKRGSKILFQDDFSGEKVGEFPSKWELNSGTCEVKTFNGTKVIEITDNGFITPLIKQEGAYLTDEFTIEFDYYYWTRKEDIGINNIKLVLNSTNDRTSAAEYSGEDVAFVAEFPVEDGNTIDYNYFNRGKTTTGSTKYTFSQGWHTVQLSFNQRAMKVYVDGNRVINLPNVAKAAWFGFHVPFSYQGLTFVKNVVLAQGAVELYNRNATDADAITKAMAETGKFVTNNILFETGKADIKAESMVEIQKVATYMKANPSVRFEVQGHCDNQGSDKVNDPLSQKRSEAIVAELVKLGVDEFNLKAVGKGSHEPVADNKTEEGRAKNRRVEFIKR